MTANYQRTIEPVLHYSIRLANSIHDRVRLEIRLDKVPVAPVANASTWLAQARSICLSL